MRVPTIKSRFGGRSPSEQETIFADIHKRVHGCLKCGVLLAEAVLNGLPSAPKPIAEEFLRLYGCEGEFKERKQTDYVLGEILRHLDQGATITVSPGKSLRFGTNGDLDGMDIKYLQTEVKK